MMIIDNAFEIGDEVYLKTDIEQLKRICTSFQITKLEILYELSLGGEVTRHYDFELTREKDVVLTTTG